MEAAVNLEAAQKETLRLQFLTELDTEFYNKKTTREDLTFFWEWWHTAERARRRFYLKSDLTCVGFPR